MPVSQPQKVFTHTEPRRWIRVRGPDALRFLNGMWTFDLKRATHDKTSLSSGAGFLLSNKGKAVVEGVFVAESENSFLLSLPEAQAEAAIETLNKYLIADDVEVEFSRDFENCHVLSESPFTIEKLPSEVPFAKDTLFKVNATEWGLRVPRGLLGKGHEEWWVKKGASLPFEVKELSEADWAALRVEHGVPAWNEDLSVESFPLEFPLPSEISFFKGCYIGQEVIARATFRGHVTRVFARFEAEAPLEKSFIYLDEDPERPVGKLSTLSHHKALGLVRVHALETPSRVFQKDANGNKIYFKKIEALVNEDTYKSTGP